MNKKFDPYEVLGVDRNATEAEIKKLDTQLARTPSRPQKLAV